MQYMQYNKRMYRENDRHPSIANTALDFLSMRIMKDSQCENQYIDRHGER